MAVRRPRRALVVGAAVPCLWMLLSQRPAGFVGPAAESRTELEAPRRQLLQILPALALGGAALPSYGDSGVTKAWGLRPDGTEDDIHLGGVAWEDIKVGTGAIPRMGDLIAVDYKLSCVVKEREITIENTKGNSKDFRFGVGQMIPGMDEGVKGMRTGGKRKLQIPGNMAFGSKGVPAALGRPAVPPMTPVEVVITLNFIPGRDEVYEYGEDAVAAATS